MYWKISRRIFLKAHSSTGLVFDDILKGKYREHVHATNTCIYSESHQTNDYYFHMVVGTLPLYHGVKPSLLDIEKLCFGDYVEVIKRPSLLKGYIARVVARKSRRRIHGYLPRNDKGRK